MTESKVKSGLNRGMPRVAAGCAAVAVIVVALASQFAVVGSPGDTRAPAFTNQLFPMPVSQPTSDSRELIGGAIPESFRTMLAAVSYGSFAVPNQQPVNDAVAILVNGRSGTNQPEAAEVIVAHGLDPQNRPAGDTGRPGFMRRLQLTNPQQPQDVSPTQYVYLHELFNRPKAIASGDFNPPSSAQDQIGQRRSGDLVIGFENESTLAIVHDFDNAAFYQHPVSGPTVRDSQDAINLPFAGGGGLVRVPFNCSGSSCAPSNVNAVAAKDLNNDNKLDIAIIADGTTPAGTVGAAEGTYLFICLQQQFPNFICSARGHLQFDTDPDNGSGGGKECDDTAMNRGLPSGGVYSDKVGDCSGGGGSGPRRKFSSTFTILPASGPEGGFTGISSAGNSVFIIEFRGDISTAPHDAVIKRLDYPQSLSVVAATAATYDRNAELDLIVQLQPATPFTQISNPADRPFSETESYGDPANGSPAYPYLEISRDTLDRPESRERKIFVRIGSGVVPEFRVAAPMIWGDFANQTTDSQPDWMPEVVVATDECEPEDAGDPWSTTSSTGRGGVTSVGGLNSYYSYAVVRPRTLTSCPSLGNVLTVAGELAPNTISGGDSALASSFSTDRFLPDIAVIRDASIAVNFTGNEVLFPRTISFVGNRNRAR